MKVTVEYESTISNFAGSIRKYKAKAELEGFIAEDEICQTLLLLNEQVTKATRVAGDSKKTEVEQPLDTMEKHK